MGTTPEQEDIDPADRRSAVRAGVVAAAPMLLGVVPFALVAGAAPIAAGLEVREAVGLSIIVFAGASQLAVVDVLGSGGGVVIAVVTALTINLRMLLYSASLAPALAHEPLRRRLAAAYFLVDQAYALSIVRWTGADDRRLRLPFYLAVGATLGISWVSGTLVGALAGSSVPDDVPLDFAIPLVFLVLLVPVLQRWPSVVAAAVGGTAAVMASELGAARLSIVIGGVSGIVAGVLAEARGDDGRRRRRRHRSGATMSTVWITIVLTGIGTYALRASFLAAARRLVDLPPLTERVLRQIPPAVLAALVLPALVRPDGDLDLWQPRLLAGVVAALVSWRTRSIALTLVIGMAVLVGIEQLT